MIDNWDETSKILKAFKASLNKLQFFIYIFNILNRRRKSVFRPLKRVLKCFPLAKKERTGGNYFTARAVM